MISLGQFTGHLPSAGKRTRDGLEVAKAKGRRLGRPSIDSEKLDAALKLVDAGLRLRMAARQVGIGGSTVYRTLKHKAEGKLDG